MTFGIRTFSAYLKDADGFLEQAPPLAALDQCVDRLAQVLGFDSAWYGFMSWGQAAAGGGARAGAGGPGVVVHGTATLNLPGGYFQAWQAMRHDDLLLDQISRAPRQVAIWRRGEHHETEGLAAMADRYDLGAVASATQIRADLPGALFLACYRRGGVGIRNWHADEQDFIYAAVEVLDRQIRDRAERPMVAGGTGVDLLVSMAGHCIFGGARLRAVLGIDVDGPLRHRLQSGFRAALAGPDPVSMDDLGLVVTAMPKACSDDAGLRAVHVASLTPASRLSPREAEVAALLVQGLNHKQVARQLGVAPATVRNQTSRIYDKLGVGNRATLAAALGAAAPAGRSGPGPA
ncbi:hypothetical protein GCM10011505_09940 [Tistrella bauzanensis]|uniref:HTH luxR-type domain-containing protein n=1 Tax=Tistrella bauzanensis TaxID=657419 RepID=A0ABQ1I9N3_9PROT|nr:helix-turn-helix transcriptional regulator [Tistrella bauzanensis]GGB30585.1 hypothetical protein GCM10011505_09940 [Tistrella bauzanensis]